MIIGAYEPNSAPTNRALSFIRVLEEQKVKTEVVFVTPNREYALLKDIEYKYIEFNYLWSRNILKSRLMSKLLEGLRINRFVKNLHNNDKVFLFGGANYLHKFVNKSNIIVYHERTEHPNVLKLRFGFAQKRYLSACTKLSGLFVISTSLKQFFISIGVPENKITIVNMTVDPQRFDGVIKESVSEKYIAYCGTASNNKDGVNKLIEAFGIVAQRHKDVKLYIIGKTPSKEDISGNLKLIEALGIKESVVFTGVVSAADMPQILTNAAVLALARPNNLQAQNGFPTKLGEYLLTGNPVVVTSVGDIPLFLKDQESALIAEPGNIQEFADKLCFALEKPEIAHNIGLAGREVALSYFNASVETLKIINIIKP